MALIALYAFGLGAVAWAACGMDRAEMAQSMAMAAGVQHDCHESGGEGAPLTAVCAAHCTSDAQFYGIQPVPVPTLPDIAVLVLEPAPARLALAPPDEVPPPGPPHRILLHSFLV